VRDQTSAETLYINIPGKADVEDVELNEEQLEAVAGGCWDGPNPVIDIIKDIKTIFAPTTGPTHDSPITEF
jgi:hypothetical protein